MPVSPHRVHHPVNHRGVAEHLHDHRRHLNTLQSHGTFIGSGAVQSGDISSVDGADILPNSVTTTQIQAGTIQASDIQSGTITSNQIAAATIQAFNIQAGAITTNTIAAGAVTATTIAAGAITTAAIQAGAVTATTIAAGAISSYVFAGNSITLAASGTSSSKVLLDQTGLKMYDTNGVVQVTMSAQTGNFTVTSGTITGATIQTSANNINKVILDVSGIRAYDGLGNNTVTIDLNGNFTATKGTITGATFQTGTGTASKVQMDSTGIKAYDAAGNQSVTIDTSGTLTVLRGSITLSGSVPAGTNARVSLDSTGIKAYNASNTQTFLLDATTGLIQCTGVLTAQAGSVLPAGSLVGSLPGGANRYSNSSFQNGQGVFDSSQWTYTGMTVASGGTTVPPVYGQITMAGTMTATSGYILTNVPSQPAPPNGNGYPGDNTDPYKRVMPGLNYAFSHYIWPTTAASPQGRIDVQWFNSSGSLLSTTTGTVNNITTGQWNRVTQVATAPAGAYYARGVHYILNVASGNVMYWDAFQMELGDAPSGWAPRPDEILYQKINANNINVANLAAINANLGTITAGTLSSVTINSGTLNSGTINSTTILSSTITGNVVQSSGSDPRTVLDTGGFHVTNSSGTYMVAINATNGLSLTATPAGQTAGPINRVEWNHASANGQMIGTIECDEYNSGSTTQFSIYAWTQADNNRAPAYIQPTQIQLASDTTTDTGNMVWVRVYNGARSGNIDRVIIRGDGSSDFAQTSKNLSDYGSIRLNSSTDAVIGGNYGMGASSPQPNVSGGYGLGINCMSGNRLVHDWTGSLKFWIDATNVGTLSDARYKKNIRPLKDAIGKIRGMKGVQFDWDHYLFEGTHVEKDQHGLLAQDVREVLPDAVEVNCEGTDNEHFTLNYGPLLATLVEAIKELADEVDNLKRLVPAVS